MQLHLSSSITGVESRDSNIVDKHVVFPGSSDRISYQNLLYRYLFPVSLLHFNVARVIRFKIVEAAYERGNYGCPGPKARRGHMSDILSIGNNGLVFNVSVGRDESG
jgi:hypothetical protein